MDIRVYVWGRDMDIWVYMWGRDMDIYVYVWGRGKYLGLCEKEWIYGCVWSGMNGYGCKSSIISYNNARKVGGKRYEARSRGRSSPDSLAV